MYCICVVSLVSTILHVFQVFFAEHNLQINLKDHLFPDYIFVNVISLCFNLKNSLLTFLKHFRYTLCTGNIIWERLTTTIPTEKLESPSAVYGYSLAGCLYSKTKGGVHNA